MRYSRIWIIFVIFYLIIAVPLLIVSINSSDIKGSVVFGQLAVAPAMIILSMMNLADTIMNYPWLNNFFSGTLLSAGIAYAVGWTTEAFVRTEKRENSTPPVP
jgi:hypothetical protein